MMARYDSRNAAALAKLTKQGVQVKQYSKEILNAAQKAAMELYDEYAAKDADFKKIYESWKTFKAESDKWFGLNEYAMEGFLFGKS